MSAEFSRDKLRAFDAGSEGGPAGERGKSRQPPLAGIKRAVHRTTTRAVRRWQAWRTALTARDLPAWTAEADSALELLEQNPRFPPGLLRVLMQPRSAMRKRLILMEDRGVPVALAGLRFICGRWSPVTYWIVPGAPFVARDDDLIRVLQVLALPLEFSWWRCPEPPPVGSGIVRVQEQGTHQIDLKADFEALWKSTSNLSSVMNARKRCAGFRVVLNPVGGAAWTIRGAGAQWKVPVGVTEDHVAVAEWLASRDRHVTAVLYDGEQMIAGNSIIVDGDTVVGHTMFRDRKYDKFRPGVFLADWLTRWAADAGFAYLDLGGGFDYKNAWGPVAGRKYTLHFDPPHHTLAQRIRGLWGRLAGSDAPAAAGK